MHPYLEYNKYQKFTQLAWDVSTEPNNARIRTERKGKGKAPARGPRMLGDDAISTMTQAQMTAEIKELEGLKEDLALKVSYLRPLESHMMLTLELG